ncbi:hypothetical protein FKM82_001539 [Ascaphus truei]
MLRIACRDCIGTQMTNSTRMSTKLSTQVNTECVFLFNSSPTTPDTPFSPTTPVTPISPNATPSKHSCRGHHLHTVGGVAERNVCTRCSNKRWHLFKSPQKHKEQKKIRHGAVTTVLSVGRFRVEKVESKSKERKSLMSDGTEVTNGEVPSTPVKPGKRQRSGTESENASTVET